MKKQLSKSFRSPGIFFLLLLVLTVSIAYGIGITKLSFYGDDWIYIYNYHIAGPESFALFQRTDRPHSAWVYVISSAVFKESPLAYHIAVLVLRVLSVILFRSVLISAFGSRRSVDAAALLFAVYPGFQQQPIAVEFIMHFSSLVLVLASIRLMQAGRNGPLSKSIPLIIFSLACGGLAIFTCEYFIGLELTRPLFLYFTLMNTDKEPKPLKKTLLILIPYFLLTVFYFIWRIFIFSFTSYAPKLLIALQENPVGGIRQLVVKVCQDLITVLFRSYRLIFSRPANISLIRAGLILLILFAGVFFFLRRSKEENKPRKYLSANTELFLTGAVLLVLSGIPYWGTFLDVSTEFPWDRSSFSFSPGVVILIAVILDRIFKPEFFCAAAAGLTALSALFHLQNTQVYIRETEKMNDYFWQLAWRAPGLEVGTILATEAFPLDRTSDNDLSPVVNWQYAPERKGLNYAYKFFDLDLREGFYYTDPLKPKAVDHTYRSHSFSSTTEKTLGIFYRKNGCLQIIDEYNSDYPGLPDSLKHIAGLSDPGLIHTSPEKPAVPPAAVGSEGEHGYCYYFQKTALAQQEGDPGLAYSFALQTIQNDLHPVYASDLAPVVLAFLEKGDFENAETLLGGNQIGSSDTGYLCEYWKEALPASSGSRELEQFYKSHGCI